MNYSGKILNWTHINSTIASRLNILIGERKKGGEKKEKRRFLRLRKLT